jgi:hypothetical protein
VHHIPRAPIKGDGPRHSGSVNTEPNFYALPYIDDTMARVAHGMVAPAEATTCEELRIVMARATQNVLACLGGGGGMAGTS